MATGGANCLLIALLGNNSNTTTAISVTDSSGNAYQQLYSKKLSTDDNIAVFICTNPTVTTTMTATATFTNVTGSAVAFIGFSGRSRTPVDTSGSMLGPNQAVHTLTTLYPSITGCDGIAFGVGTTTTATTTWTATGVWTIRSAASGNDFVCLTVNNIATASVQDTFNTGATRGIADFVIALAPAGYGPVAATPPAAGPPLILRGHPHNARLHLRPLGNAAPPLVITDQIYCIYPDEPTDEDDEAFGAYGFFCGNEVDQVTFYYQDDADLDDLTDDSPYDFNGQTIVVGPEVVVVTGIAYIDQPELEAIDDYEEVYPDYNSTGPPPPDNDVSFDIQDAFPDPEEAEDEPFGFEFVQQDDDQQQGAIVYLDDADGEPDEDFGFEDHQLPPDNEVSFDTRGWITDQTADPPDGEDYGFQLGLAGPEVDLIVCVFPDLDDEPDDEAFGFDDNSQFDVINATVNQIEAAYVVDNDEEPDDEDFGFVYSPPEDQFTPPVATYSLNLPDQADEPEDEDLSFEDHQLPPDVVVVTDQQSIVLLADPEESEDEPFGFEFCLQDDDQQGAVALPDAEDLDDEDFAAAVTPVGTEVDLIVNVFPDDTDEPPDDEAYGHVDYQVGLEVDQVTIYYPDTVETEEDEDFGFAFTQQDDDFQPESEQVGADWQDQPEEPEDEDFTFVDWQTPPDNEVSFDTRGWCTDQTEDPPDDEDYGFQAIAGLEVDLVVCLWPDEVDPEPDEDFGFEDHQVPADFAPDQIWALYPDQADEPEDEDHGFAQPPGDDIDLIVPVFPDSEEPEDEPFAFQFTHIEEDFQPEAEQVGADYPAEAEEPEEEPYGFTDDPRAADNEISLDIQATFPDGEEPEDEDHGFGAVPAPAEQQFTQDQFYPTLGDDLPEDEEEPYGFEDHQAPPDFIPPPAPPAVLDPTLLRPSRRNVRFKWGVTEPKQPLEASKPQKQAAKPSALLQKLIRAIDFGEKATGIGEVAAPAEPALRDVPRETSPSRISDTRKLERPAPAFSAERRKYLAGQRKQVADQLVAVRDLLDRLEKAHAAALHRQLVLDRRRNRLKAVADGKQRRTAQWGSNAALRRLLARVERLEDDLQQTIRKHEVSKHHDAEAARAEIRRREQNLIAIHTAIRMLLRDSDDSIEFPDEDDAS